MKTKEIADKLVAFCREGNFEAAQRELFADAAVSIEPKETAMSPKETKGLPAIIEKSHKFHAMTEKVHSLNVSDPIATDNVFACTMSLDITMKGQSRMTMSELCVYEVKNGKIISEHFHA
jgi:limonene-1,2-epoxide hydrolase